MSSANEHLPPPPKPKISPLEFRNTDLVSRLLAATPPYLYNMSLLPNTYFFSEMLRSLVQAKAERNAAHSATHPQVRRARKRHWSVTPSYHQKSTLIETANEIKPADPDEWMLKSNKKIQDESSDATATNADRLEKIKPLEQTMGSAAYQQPKIETRLPSEHQLVSSAMQHHQSHTDSSPQNLVLPPAPPIWYPPLYPPSPYGIDPLHFFIDLRVSGHIYDRKNSEQKESIVNETITKREENVDDVKQERHNFNGILRQNRHSSAFSVPVPSRKSQEAINLSEKETKPTKFDVKSMGFDKSSNKTSTNYVMSNINSIYRGIDRITDENRRIEDVHEKVEEMSEEEKEKNDLRTLIGLELAVNYMSPKTENDSKEHNDQNGGSHSSSDVESVGSPALEVVAIQDDN